MQEAIHYGKVELIPGIICDGYVLNDGTAVMSERGTADLLGMNQMALNRMKTTWPPKTLQPFIDHGLGMKTTLVKVVSQNSPYEGRKIVVYNTNLIEAIIRAYVMASAHSTLQKNQLHIGKRCSILVCALTRTALEVSIKQAAGLSIDIQKTAQQHYQDAAKLLKEFGFTCSVNEEIAIKKDITKFLDVPESTLNNFLRKHQNEIQPIKLDYSTIRSMGYKAPRMNAYHLDDVGKIAVGMDTVIGIELKQRVFGEISSLAKPETKGEIEWRKVLTKVFAGFGLQCNYPIGNYKADFFIEKLMLVLECNGYDNHQYYDKKLEKQREQFIKQRYSMVRFHHKIQLETLFNGILQAKIGTVIKLYNNNTSSSLHNYL
jgi:very-short-patch-repair endonuclease